MARLTRERDEARELWRREETRMREAEWAFDAAGVSATAPMPPGVAGCQTFSVAERIGTLAAQRDEARAEAAQLQEILITHGKLQPPKPWPPAKVRESDERAEKDTAPAGRSGDCAACPHPGSEHLGFSGLCTADGCPCIEHEPRGGGDA